MEKLEQHVEGELPFFGLVVHSEVPAFHIIVGSGVTAKHRPSYYGPNWTVEPYVIDVAGELVKWLGSCFLLKCSEDCVDTLCWQIWKTEQLTDVLVGLVVSAVCYF